MCRYLKPFLVTHVLVPIDFMPPIIYITASAWCRPTALNKYSLMLNLLTLHQKTIWKLFSFISVTISETISSHFHNLHVSFMCNKHEQKPYQKNSAIKSYQPVYQGNGTSE